MAPVNVDVVGTSDFITSWLLEEFTSSAKREISKCAFGVPLAFQ
jgi:hypothetical protein